MQQLSFMRRAPRRWGSDYMCKLEWQRICYCDINCFTVMLAVSFHIVPRKIRFGPQKLEEWFPTDVRLALWLEEISIHPSQLHQSPWTVLTQGCFGELRKCRLQLGRPPTEHFSPGSKNGCKHNYVFAISKVSI